MRLTSFSDYTLRVLMYLALDEQGASGAPARLTTIPEIAGAYDISENHLMKVVQQLVARGLIESVRGRGGGIRLARPPASIRIGEVVRASEGEGSIVECLSGEKPGCRIARTCKLQRVLVDAFDALYERLDRHTLADLVENPRPLLLALGRR